MKMISTFSFLLLTLTASCGNAQQTPAPVASPTTAPPTSPSPASPAPPSPPDDYPKQAQCTKIPAKRYYQAGPSAGAWVLAKITPLPDPPPQQFITDENFCSPFSYLRGTCQWIVIRIVEFEDDKSITLQTFSYNSRKKSLVHFANNAQLMDHWYAVYQGNKTALMEEYFDDNRYKLVNPIPQLIIDTQGEEYVKVARSGHNKWMVFQNCVTNYAWVLMRVDVKIRELWKYQYEFVTAMRALKIDVDSMVDTPIIGIKWGDIL